MDKITESVLELLSKRNPRYAIRLSHQFLDDETGSGAGLVPDDWNGKTIRLIGKWWDSPEWKLYE